MTKHETGPLDPFLDDRELLLHRFLDHDLDPEERIRFLELLDQDAGLRRDLVDMERLFLKSSQLRRLSPPGDLKARILGQLRGESETLWQWFTHRLFAPQILHWNPASALAVLAMLLAFVWGIGTFPGGHSLTPPGSLVSIDEQESPVLVRLILVNAQAQSVSVAGDFNGWTPEKTPLRQTRDGVWAVTLKVLPGRYQYMYVIDGNKWVTDPLAVEYAQDGFGSNNAVLDVEYQL